MGMPGKEKNLPTKKANEKRKGPGDESPQLPGREEIVNRYLREGRRIAVPEKKALRLRAKEKKGRLCEEGGGGGGVTRRKGRTEIRDHRGGGKKSVPIYTYTVLLEKVREGGKKPFNTRKGRILQGERTRTSEENRLTKNGKKKKRGEKGEPQPSTRKD